MSQIVSDNINKIVKAIQEVGNQLENRIENLGEKMDKTYETTSNSLTTLQHEYANQNKALEIELTLGIKDFMLDYATKHGLKYSYKTGRNYPKKLKNPRDNDELLTDIDGSYILSNNHTNAKVENTSMHDSMNVLLNARLATLSKKIAHGNMNSADRSKEITHMKKALNKYSSITREAKNNADYKDSLGAQNVIQNKRYLVIVEAKQCLSQELLQTDVMKKMKNIIRFFIDVNLYYKAKIYKWGVGYEFFTPEFIQLCETYNLNFDGIVFIIGGSYITENINNTFKEVCGKFNSYLINLTHQTIENSQEMNKKGYEYNIWKSQITRDFLFNLFIDHRLVLVNGNRFKQTAQLFP